MKTLTQPTYSMTKRREPMQFMLWLGIGGSVMVFTILLAIYLIRQTASDWKSTPLPQYFLISTAIILFSSLTLHVANMAFKKDRFGQYRLYMATTALLGTIFILLQFLGWKQLIDSGMTATNNISAAFVYVLSGLHIIHIACGIVALTWAFIDSLRHLSYIDSFVYSVNPPNQLKIKLITIYWHFVDVLWLYLFAFLVYHHGI